MFDLLGLPNISKVMLHDAPLVLALFQVRFSSMLNVNDPATLSSFQKAVYEKYPLALPAHQVELLIGMETNESGMRQEQRRTLQWQFTDQEDNWRMVLSQDSLSLETRNYEHFEHFLIRLREALDVLMKYINPTIGTRIGLRYINEIRPTSYENWNWLDVINRSLLGPLSEPELLQNTVQITSIQQVLLRYSNDLGITINHGLVPSGTTVRLRPKEETPKSPFYLLDFDVFRDFSFAQPLEMKPKVICDQIEEYHKLVYRLFRWSVTDKYISRLGA